MAVPKRIACVRIIRFHSKLDLKSHSLEEAVQKLAEACFRFTPQIALRKDEAVFLDVSQSLHLFSEYSIQKRIEVLAKRLGLQVKVTFSSHACLSLAQSYYERLNQTGSLKTLPIEALVFFQNPFDPHPEDTQKLQKLAESMKTFGILNMEQFFQLSPQSIGSRFGKFAVLAYAFAKGETHPAWNGFKPSEVIEERQELGDEDLDGTEVTLEPLLFSLKSLMDRAMVRLVGLGKRASRVFIELKMAPWSHVQNPVRSWDISLPLAQGTSMGLLPILREYLSFQLSQAPLSAPARSLYFKVLETVPGHGAQKNFFDTKEQEAENWDQLLGRLLSLLGPEHVFQATLVNRYCPEKSWQKRLNPKGMSQTSPLPTPHVRRPSRILKVPEPLHLKPSLLLHPSGKSWSVKTWEGPERISTEWWKEPFSREVDRDYYQITTQGNEKLWVFFDRNIHPPQAFLHGFFD